MTLAIERSPGGAPSRRRVSAVQRWRAANQLHTTGVVSRAQSTPCGCHWRPRRAETLTKRDYTKAARTKRSTTILAGPDERKRKEVPMRDLNYDLKQLCQHNRDGSYATQADREHILDLIADQLHEMGFRHMNAHSLKPKHVEKLVERWLAEELSPGTIKNRMSALRWWAEKIGKENIIARTNAVYGTNISKAKELDMDKLEQIPDLFIHMSLCFQALFGLRREESIKIIPAWADRGDRLVLKDSWTKGGREREIPIRTEEQRELIEQAKVLAKGKSLVAPYYKTYRDYLKYFRYKCERVGIHSFHGHRHFYAQLRYKELTGRECPARGGTKSKQLTPKQKAIERHAREVISREMGHSREQITAVYCGVH